MLLSFLALIAVKSPDVGWFIFTGDTKRLKEAIVRTCKNNQPAEDLKRKAGLAT
jgi:hypothetical protein